MGFETTLFLEPPNETLFCGICSDVLKVATTACSEGHAFCKGCLVPSVTCCPTCRGSLQKTNCLPLQRIIDALIVKCPNQRQQIEEESSAPQPKQKRRKTSLKSTTPPKDSCDWTGPLSELQRHEAQYCKFQLVQCEHDGCKEMVFRKNLKKHGASCGFRPTKCSKCKERITHSMLREHLCPKEMTACPYCNKRMLRKELLGAGAPTFVHADDKAASASAVAVAACLSDNNNDQDDDDSEDGSSSPTRGSVLFGDIMNERIPFVPTDAQCQGHYKVCPEVPLRCEFHEQGCTERIKRKDLAQHHANSAQRHAALVAKSLRDIPTRLERILKREKSTLYFSIAGERFSSTHDYRNLLSSSATVADYDFRLKFHQYRDQDEPIAVSIRANVGSSYTSLKLDLYDIYIRIVKELRTNEQDNETEAQEDEEIVGGFFKCAGPHTLQYEPGCSYGVLQFKTQLCVKGETEPYAPMTGAHLQKMMENLRPAHARKLHIMASFSLAKRTVKDLGGIYDTSSPCPSPGHNDYGDY